MNNVSDSTVKMTRRSFMERAGQLGAMLYNPLGALAGSNIAANNLSKTRKILPEGNGIFTNIWVGPSEFYRFMEHKIKYVYFDIGDVDKTTGKITTPQDQIEAFANNLASFEQENEYTFIKLPWNVVIPEEGYRFDSVGFRQNYLDEYVRIVKQFNLDGIHVDIEAVPGDLKEAYLGMIWGWRKRLPEDSIISVYGGAIIPDRDKNATKWTWSESFPPRVFASGADIISIQTYDIGSGSEEEYRQYLRDQIKRACKYADGRFKYAVPEHKNWPELSKVAIEEYFEGMLNNCSWPFLGMDLFATWTMTEEDWDAFGKNSKIPEGIIYGIRKELSDIVCSVF